ncbi:MAG: neutral/alkaline non-lysosomal ceramidase N-terminal domain-containing protein [Victivallales bacterium]|nr:neutral/alkaline non-lysosomal ceramidase N-terminal domain-containing protein [Victivallales bacterium]
MKIGFAVSDITPELGIYLTGYGRPERLAEAVHSPLTATAMYLDNGGTQAVVIGLDWCFVDWDLTKSIRKAINAATGVPDAHILLCCSHTHSAPHTTYMRTLGRVAVDPENKGIDYVFKSIPAIVDAVKRAQEGSQECEAGISACKTKACTSRRGMDENGKVTGFICDDYMIHDDNLTAVMFRSCKKGELLGIMIHACGHNTALGGFDTHISSDWCGVMRSRIRGTYDVPVLFVNGGFGDMGPRSNRWVENETLKGFSAGGGDGIPAALEVGFVAATDALRALADIREFHSELPLAVNVGEVRMPQALSMSEEEAKRIVASFDAADMEKKAEPDVRYQIAKTLVAEYRNPPQPELVFEQSIVAFGPIALVPFPFEVFSIFSLRLRKYGPFQYNLLCGNTNGRNAYMPDRGAFAMGGYEPECLKTVRPYVIKPEAGDLALTQSLAALRRMIGK